MRPSAPWLSLEEGVLERMGGAREGLIFPRPCAASTTGHCVLKACYASGHSCYRASDYRSLQPRPPRFERQKPSALPLHSGTLKSSVADSPPRYGSPQITVDSALSLYSGRSMLQHVSALLRSSAVRAVYHTAATSRHCWTQLQSKGKP